MKKRTTTGHAAAKRPHAWPVRFISIAILLCLLLAGCAQTGVSDTAQDSTQETEQTEKAEKTEESERAEKAEKAEKAGAADSAIADSGAQSTAGSAAANAGTESTESAAAATDTSGRSGTAGTMTGAAETAAPAGTTSEDRTAQPEPLTQEQKTEKMIRQYMQTLSLEDKVSGLFILTPEQLTGYGQVTEAGDATREALQTWPVAGLVYFAGNILDREQVQQMLDSTREWGSAYISENTSSQESETAETAEAAAAAVTAAASAEAAGTQASAETSEIAETAETAAASAEEQTAEEEPVEEEQKSGTAIPPFLAIDEEGGIVARIGNSAIEVPYVGSMGNVGASGDPEQAYEAGSTIGEYLQDLGFNLDFAPDADVLVDPSNVTIGERSFGSDPELCGQMVHRFIDGLHEHGIASCIKHFPGLGDTESDTHTSAAWSSRTIDDYRGTEFVSFRGGIDAGTEMVMISHLSNSELTGSDLPASLNKTVITDILREELEYDGIVITDSLRMGAVSERFDSAEAAVMAVEAGADILLMPADFSSARQGIIDAVQNGRISEERIDESLDRILRTRAALAEQQGTSDQP